MQTLIELDIAWSDLDANRHVANTAFMKKAIDCRINFFKSIGWDINRMTKENIGPIIFNESFYYIKEIHPDEHMYVNVELLGYAEDYKFIQFCHNMFNSNRALSVYSTLVFGWIDMKERKLVDPAGGFENTNYVDAKE